MPTDPAVFTDAPALVVAGILERSESGRVGLRRRKVDRRGRRIREGFVWPHLVELGAPEVDALLKLCKSTSVDIADSKGQITVSPGHEMGFLEVLDRRRYELELVKGKPERYKAASRSKIDG